MFLLISTINFCPIVYSHWYFLYRIVSFWLLFTTKQQQCHCNDQEGRKEGAKPSPGLLLVGFAAENPVLRKDFIENLLIGYVRKGKTDFEVFYKS
jgi:hypothetical protein